MIVSTSLVMASVMATMVQALPNRFFARQTNSTTPDRNDLTNLRPVDWRNLLQGSYDPYVQQLFENLDLNYTHNAVALSRSSYITNISCVSNTSLVISFSNKTAFDYIKNAWQVEDQGQEFVVITPTSGCRKSPTESSYYLVTNVTYPSASDLVVSLQVEDLTAPEWAINCNAPTDNKTYLGLPTAPCSNSFDPLLDSRIGYYNFDKNFTSDLKRFAPGLQSYNESDYVALGSQKRKINHFWHKRAPLNPSVIGRAIADVTIVNAIENIDSLALFAQSIQEEAIYVPDRIDPDSILSVVPFAPVAPPQPAPAPVPVEAPAPAPVQSEEQQPQPIVAPAPDASQPPAQSQDAPAPAPLPSADIPASLVAPAPESLPVAPIPVVPSAPSAVVSSSVVVPSSAAVPSSVVVPPSAVVPSSAIVPSAVPSSTPPLVQPSPLPSSIIPPTSQPSSLAPSTVSSTISSTISSTVSSTTTSSSISTSSDFISSDTSTSVSTSSASISTDTTSSDTTSSISTSSVSISTDITSTDTTSSTSTSTSSDSTSDTTTTETTTTTDISTTTTFSSSSSSAIDTCSYLFSDAMSQYKRCGDTCTTICRTGACNTYCPSTSPTSAPSSTTPPSTTPPPPTTTPPPTTAPPSTTSSPPADPCSYLYSDAVSQYRYCPDGCVTACSAGSCQTDCPSTTPPPSTTTSPSTTAPPSTIPSPPADPCSYLYSDAVSQYRYCPDGCVTACSAGNCQTDCPSTTPSSQSPSSVASTTTTPAPVSSGGGYVSVIPPSSAEPSSTDPTPSTSFDPEATSFDPEATPSTSFDPEATSSSIILRKRQDIAGSVAKLGQTLGYRQTPIRESSQAYGAVGDEQGNIRMASQQVSEQVPWNTWGDTAVTDSLDRFLHYFPDTMDKFGVSRLRVADGEQIPEGSSAVAFSPIDVSTTRGTQSKRQSNRARSVYVPLNTRAQPFFPIMCTFTDSLVSKLYLANTVRGVQTLQNPRLRKVLTGGKVKNCGVVSLESRTVAGISSSSVRGRQ